VTWNTSRYKTAAEAMISERFGGLMVFASLIKVLKILFSFFFIEQF
jgi:hypothetical protein